MIVPQELNNPSPISLSFCFVCYRLNKGNLNQILSNGPLNISKPIAISTIIGI
jgi:hypothetical protein